MFNTLTPFIAYTKKKRCIYIGEPIPRESCIYVYTCLVYLYVHDVLGVLSSMYVQREKDVCTSAKVSLGSFVQSTVHALYSCMYMMCWGYSRQCMYKEKKMYVQIDKFIRRLPYLKVTLKSPLQEPHRSY